MSANELVRAEASFVSSLNRHSGIRFAISDLEAKGEYTYDEKGLPTDYKIVGKFVTFDKALLKYDTHHIIVGTIIAMRGSPVKVKSVRAKRTSFVEFAFEAEDVEPLMYGEV